jgi:hypothetical protein
VGGEHAGVAEMIFIGQLPGVDHFTPVNLGERNDINA